MRVPDAAVALISAWEHTQLRSCLQEMHGKFPKLSSMAPAARTRVCALRALALARTMRSAIMMMIRSRYTSSSAFFFFSEVANCLHRLLGLGR